MDLKTIRSYSVFGLNILSNNLERLMTRYYRREVGIGLPEAKIIGVVGTAADGITVNDLCARAFLDRTHGSRLINDLERRGLLRREVNPSDSRSSIIFLTDEGRAIFKEIGRVLHEIEQDLFSSFDARETEVFDYLVESVTARVLARQQEDGIGTASAARDDASIRKDLDVAMKRLAQRHK